MGSQIGVDGIAELFGSDIESVEGPEAEEVAGAEAGEGGDDVDREIGAGEEFDGAVEAGELDEGHGGLI